MAMDLTNERGDIIGTRITVYDLLPQFLDPTVTETYLCRMYSLSPEQVAAARAYVFRNLDTVLAHHLKIEARIAAGNPPEVIEQAERTRAALQGFKEWLVERDKAEAADHAAEPSSAKDGNGRQAFPSFREWFAQRESKAAGSS